MSTAPIKPPTPKCGVCGLTSSDLVSDGTAQETLEASQRLGSSATGWRCPDPDRCRRMLKGLPLSDDRRFGNPKKFDLDEFPDPPRVPYHDPPPRTDDEPDHGSNGVT